MKKNLFLILMVISATSFAKDLTQECYLLKDVMKDTKMGKSRICKFLDINNLCFFTSDQGWYTHSYQVQCGQFRSIRNYVGDHPELSVVAFDPNTSQADQ